MNTKSILKKAERLHQKAIGKSRVLTIKGKKYIVWYNANKRSFETTLPDATEGPTWNTRELPQAINWTIEYFNN